MKLDLELRWIDIESKPGQAYHFPEAPTIYMRRYRTPAVYRWAILGRDGTLESVYVGEAEDLRRRLGDYLRTGNRKTALRVSAFLRERLKDHRQILFQTVVFETFAVNLSHFDCSKLSDPFARKVVENLAILESLQSHCKLLNKGIDATHKKIQAVFDAVPEFSSQFSEPQKAELKARLKQLSATRNRSETDFARS